MARILVIDDEKNIRKTVRMTLAKAGYEVELAEDGWEGLERFGDGSDWDLVLVDQRMPKLEGREVIHALRQRDPGARSIMMTAFSTIELSADVLQAGATDFLRKPFSTDLLRGAVEVALARPRAEVVPAPEPVGAIAPATATPQITVYVNGFHFWPVSTTDDEALTQVVCEVRRSFLVKRPLDGEIARCVVGATPHVYALVHQETNREHPESDTLWDMTCSTALANHLLTTPQLPPPFLPVYELTSGQLYDIRESLGLGPFASRF